MIMPVNRAIRSAEAQAIRAYLRFEDWYHERGMPRVINN